MTGASSMESPAYVSKWFTFAASALIQVSSGLSYSFSIYAPTMKDALELTQTQIATVGSCVNLGGYFAVLSGTIYDLLKDHHRLGPRLVVWLGCLSCFCGYLGMFLMVSGRAPSNFGQLLILAAAAGNMGTWLDTSALVTSVRNFPTERGKVVGLLKSFLGLSSSVYTTLYVAAFNEDATRFLLLLALAPSAACLLLSAALNYVPFVETSEAAAPGAPAWRSSEGRFLISFLIVGALALYQMVSAVAIGQRQLGAGGMNVVLAGMGLLLLLAACLPALTCGGWRAVYAHAYVTTRESQADDEAEQQPGHGGCAAGGSSCGGGEPLQPWQGGVRGSDRALPGHLHAHYRAAAGSHGQGGGSTSCSSSQASSRSPVLAGLARGPPAAARSSAGGAARLLPGLGPRRPSSSSDHDAGDEDVPLLVPPGSSGAGADGIVSSSKPGAAGAAAGLPPRQPGDAAAPALPSPQLGSLTMREMLATLDFWLLFLQFTVASGACLAYLNNLGQLVASLGGGHDGQVVFVSLFSVANAAGRLLMGYWPETCLHSRGTPRTLFLTGTAAVTSAACLGVAYARLGHLYVLSILLGAAFGAHWCLLPSITSDLFGLKHFASNYTTLQLAPACGSYLLATRLVGFLYDRTAAAHGDPHACIGPECFREAFLLLAGAAAVGSIACSVATARSRRAYLALAHHLRQVTAAEAHGGDGDSNGL